MKRLSLIALVAAFVVSAFAFLASSAFAIPVFARKYNTQCNMCHTVPPRLNKFGVAFKENGFELPPGTVLPESEVYGNQVLSNDEPKAIVGAGFPFMIRTGLTADLSTSNGTASGTATVTSVNNRFLGLAPGEFGLIGGGSMETSIAGLGFWIDAPGAIIGAIDLDFNFNPMFKVSLGNDAPKVGYALGLTPIYVGGNTRNPATQSPIGAFAGVIALGTPAGVPAATFGNGFVWGNSSNPGIDIRGTTNPSTGLGLNYSVGYRTGPIGPTATAPATDSSTFYGHVGYFIDAINSNIGVGYSSENTGAANTSSATQLLVDFAYNVGENFMATVIFNSATPAVGTGVTAANITTIAVQPEFAVSPTISVGGRFVSSTLNANVAGTPNATATEISVGANYKLLQNILGWANYRSTSADNNATAAAGRFIANSSSIQAGVDFIF